MKGVTHDCRPLLLVAALLCSACGGGGESGQGDGSQAEAEIDLASRGRHYYHQVCTACHNGDPSVEGTLGPAIAGASADLLEAKVIHGRYPESYTPSRDTQTMPRFQYLAPEIGALAAYLASIPKDS